MIVTTIQCVFSADRINIDFYVDQVQLFQISSIITFFSDFLSIHIYLQILHLNYAHYTTLNCTFDIKHCINEFSNPMYKLSVSIHQNCEQL